MTVILLEIQVRLG